MNETLHIENVVLGGGEAGKYVAWDLAQQGWPAVVIERALIEESYPNIACLPSKNLIRSALRVQGDELFYAYMVDNQVYAIYAPAHHQPGKIHTTASEAAADADDEPAEWSVQPKATRADKHA